MLLLGPISESDLQTDVIASYEYKNGHEIRMFGTTLIYWNVFLRCAHIRKLFQRSPINRISSHQHTLFLRLLRPLWQFFFRITEWIVMFLPSGHILISFPRNQIEGRRMKLSGLLLCLRKWR